MTTDDGLCFFVQAKAVVHREVLERKSEAFQDPRSPTVGIDRTPMPTLASVATASPLSTTVDAFVSTVEVANVISDDAEEVQRLEKVLDFHEPEPDVALEDVVEQLLRFVYWTGFYCGQLKKRVGMVNEERKSFLRNLVKNIKHNLMILMFKGLL